MSNSGVGNFDSDNTNINKSYSMHFCGTNSTSLLSLSSLTSSNALQNRSSHVIPTIKWNRKNKQESKKINGKRDELRRESKRTSEKVSSDTTFINSNDDKKNKYKHETDNFIEYKIKIDAEYLERCKALNLREAKREEEYKYKLEEIKTKIQREQESSEELLREYHSLLERKLEEHVEKEIEQMAELFTLQWELLLQETSEIVATKTVESKQYMEKSLEAKELLERTLEKMQHDEQKHKEEHSLLVSEHHEEMSKVTNECKKFKLENELLQAEMYMKEEQIKSLLMEYDRLCDECFKCKQEMMTTTTTKAEELQKQQELQHETEIQERISAKAKELEIEHENKMLKLNE